MKQPIDKMASQNFHQSATRFSFFMHTIKNAGLRNGTYNNNASTLDLMTSFLGSFVD
jgi:hypothetical protein